MRTVKHTSRFRRDYKRQKAGRHGSYIDAELLKTVNMLSKDEQLPRVISIIRSAANGAITATVTSGPT